MHFKNLVLKLIPAIFLCFYLVISASIAKAAGPPTPPHPQILEVTQAPHAARILRQVALTYAPQMSPAERQRDMLQKIALAKRLLGVRRLVELRRQALALIPPGQEVSWESLRTRRGLGGDRVGVTLSVPVWVPARARKVPINCAFEKKWQTVALNGGRPSGYAWFDPSLADINHKSAYRAGTIQFEVNSRFAPLAALLLEYIFREGYYDPAKRLPLMNVRGGEDTYAASASSPPVTAECLTFPDHEGDSLAAAVARCRYDNLAEIYHGHHAPVSNHRLGLALDLNDFNYPGVCDGCPNPISRALRQYNRDAMHKLDARQDPAWVYLAAEQVGLRLPQEWTYEGYNTDWEHVDVGNK
jgi:hypothetical protein